MSITGHSSTGAKPVTVIPEAVEFGDVSVGTELTMELQLRASDGKSIQIDPSASDWSLVENSAGLSNVTVRGRFRVPSKGAYEDFVKIPLLGSEGTFVIVRGFGLDSCRKIVRIEALNLGVIKAGSSVSVQLSHLLGDRHHEAPSFEFVPAPNSLDVLSIDRRDGRIQLTASASHGQRGIIASRLLVKTSTGSIAQIRITGVVL